MKIKVLFLILCGACISCTVSKNTAETTIQMEALDRLVVSKAFQIESNWANPLVTTSITSIANSGLLPPGSNVNTINLIGNSNYLRMYGDSISMNLPFFGERRLSGGYNSTEVSIAYHGKPDVIEIKKNDKKQVYEIQFSAKTDSDFHDIFITLSPNLVSNITINSNYRTTISYRGKVSKLSNDNNNAVTVQ